MKLKKIDKTAIPLSRAEIRTELWSMFKVEKARWLFRLLATQIFTLLEGLLICTVYFIIDSSKRDLARAKILGGLQQIGQYIGHPISPPFLSDVQTETFFFCIALVILTALITLRFFHEKSLARLQHNLSVHYSNVLLKRYFALEISEARKIGRERIVSSILHDCRVLGVCAQRFMDIIGAVGSICFYTIAAAYCSPIMLLLAFLVYAVPFWINRVGYRKIQQLTFAKLKTHERLIGYFTDILGGFERLKLDALEKALQAKSEQAFKQDLDWRVGQTLARSQVTVFMDATAFLGLLLVLLAGVAWIEMSLSAIMVLFVIFNRIKAHVLKISQSSISIAQQLPHFFRYFQLFKEMKPSLAALEPPQETLHSIPSVSMKQVSFRYETHWVLQNIDFRAEAGDRILIQGSSGNGKSTFLEALCGLLIPQSGEIHYGEHLLTESLFYRARSLLFYASPTLYLFRDTLRANLSSEQIPEDEALKDALRQVGLESLLRELPNGLDSPLGMNGDALSLGQRQRVIFARLFLKKPMLVLLDEASSNLDPLLEEQLMRNMESHLDPKSIVILVAHKAPLGISFNKKYRFERGNLHPESLGTPDEAVVSSGTLA